MNINNLQDLSFALDIARIPLYDKIEIVNKYSGIDWVNFTINQNEFPYSRFEIPCNTCDIYVLTWNPLVSSRIHNHSEQGCIMKILNKNDYLLEHQYDLNLNFLESCKLDAKKCSFIHNKLYYHSIENPNNHKVYSLHVYQPKGHITKCF